MEYDKELIKTRIDQIKDPVQKVMLRNVLQDIFTIIMDYSEDCFGQLECKIDAELVDTEDRYFIYTGVCKKADLDESGSFLFEVQTDMQECDPGTLKTVYLACDYLSIAACLDKTFTAEVETQEHTYQIQVALNYSKKYLSKIQWLYQKFLANKKKWSTINCPYLYKFMDVVDIEQVVPKNEQIQRVILNLGELSEFLYADMILVWNVDELEAETSGQIIPGDKTMLYEHKIELQRKDAGCLAVLEEPETFYTIYNEDKLIIRTEQKSYDNIKLLQIVGFHPEKDNTKLFFSLQSNKRELRSIDSQAEKQKKLTFTIAEFHRILNSYEAYHSLKLKTVVLDDYKNKHSIDCNAFIPSHHFLDKRRQLTLIFHSQDKNDILLYEKMFFLISELQLYTEEYQCDGKLINTAES